MKECAKGRSKEAACARYAKAEKEGRAPRISNTSKMSAEAYADALWNDGDRKGWLYK